MLCISFYLEVDLIRMFKICSDNVITKKPQCYRNSVNKKAFKKFISFLITSLFELCSNYCLYMKIKTIK